MVTCCRFRVGVRFTVNTCYPVKRAAGRQNIGHMSAVSDSFGCDVLQATCKVPEDLVAALVLSLHTVPNRT